MQVLFSKYGIFQSNFNNTFLTVRRNNVPEKLPDKGELLKKFTHEHAYQVQWENKLNQTPLCEAVKLGLHDIEAMMQHAFELHTKLTNNGNPVEMPLHADSNNTSTDPP